MVVAKLKSLASPDLMPPDLPNDLRSFSVAFEAVIGPTDSEGGDIFSFTAVSAAFLVAEGRTTWGRGILFVPDFSWATIHAAVERLLRQVQRPSWDAVASELNKFLCWEFDNYQSKA